MSNDETIRLDIPATLKRLNMVGAVIQALFERTDVPDASVLAYNVQLAVQELCTNIVRHAYGDHATGRIALALVLSPQRLVIETHDSGPNTFAWPVTVSFDASSLPESGVGLHLISELMDEVSYQPAPADNAWRLVKNFEESSL